MMCEHEFDDYCDGAEVLPCCWCGWTKDCSGCLHCEEEEEAEA